MPVAERFVYALPVGFERKLAFASRQERSRSVIRSYSAVISFRPAIAMLAAGSVKNAIPALENIEALAAPPLVTDSIN